MTASQRASTALPGLEVAALERWFRAHSTEHLAGPLTAALIAGGKSNLTYDVTDGHHRWIVRRPPLGHVLATAHDMGREYRVMHALAKTAVPVPAMVAACTDATVIGAPFFVMERIDGTALRSAAQLRVLGTSLTAAIGQRMVRTLADLHAVDPISVGLADFGRPTGFLERQVRRWKSQLDASRTRDLPRADQLIELLTRRVPPTRAPAIVHGDYRLDNLLIDNGEVRAVIDWEMATLGDALTDVALLVVYGNLTSLEPEAAPVDVSCAPGYPNADEIISLYATATRHDLDSLQFHLALAHFKLAVILEGIHYRYVKGQTVGEGFDSVGRAVVPLLEAGVDELSKSARSR